MEALSWLATEVLDEVLAYLKALVMLESLRGFFWARYNKVFGLPSKEEIAVAIKETIAASKAPKLAKPQVCTILYLDPEEKTVCAPEINDETDCAVLRDKLGHGGRTHMVDVCPANSVIHHGKK